MSIILDFISTLLYIYLLKVREFIIFFISLTIRELLITNIS